MIKKQFALILILWSSLSFSQLNTFVLAQEVTIYNWKEVQVARPDTIFGISFSKKKLTELPSELAKFNNLKVLDLSKNRLSDIPAYLKEFNSLEELNLTKNKLSTFPIEICQLGALKRLLIGSNDIASLPDCIEYASELEYLDVYDNPIGYLPQSMMRLEKLKKIDFTGIRFNRDFQKQWIEQLPNTQLVFDSACDCLN